jgi:hypothetical protein
MVFSVFQTQTRSKRFLLLFVMNYCLSNLEFKDTRENKFLDMEAMGLIEQTNALFPSSSMRSSISQRSGNVSLDDVKHGEIKADDMVCPFDGCGSRRSTWSGMRTHLNESHVQWLPSEEWMAMSRSRACPQCGTGVVALATQRCSHCPKPRTKQPPKIAHLPSLSLRTDVAQITLQIGSSRPAGEWSGSGGPLGAKVTSAYDRELMAICFTNAPLMKVIPKREVALYACGVFCTRRWSASK